MTANEAIVNSLTTSATLLERYVADLPPQEYLHRPCADANCAAWILGHLILGERNALRRWGATDLPELPEGFESRFGREAGAPKAADFGDVMILLPLFKRHRALLIEAIRRGTQEQLDKRLEKPHPMFAKMGESFVFTAVHTTMHAGQITIIRRSLGRPPLI